MYPDGNMYTYILLFLILSKLIIPSSNHLEVSAMSIIPIAKDFDMRIYEFTKNIRLTLNIRSATRKSKPTLIRFRLKIIFMWLIYVNYHQWYVTGLFEEMQ